MRQCAITPSALIGLLAPIGERTGLYWVLRELSRFGIAEIAVPDAAIAQVATIAASLPRPLALVPASAQSDRVLLIARDSIFDANLAPLLHQTGTRRAEGRDGEDLGIAVVTQDGQSPRTCPTVAIASRAIASEADLRRPALFLDRDGTINVDHGYVGTRERFDWIPGARAAIRRATEAGWHVFIVTNQSGVARGFYDEAAVEALHAWLADEVRRCGGTIDDVRFCPHHPEATVGAYRRASAWRKPEPGMILDLIRAWELDPSRCLLVGDQPTDLGAATAAGIEGLLLPGGDLDEFVAPLLRSRSSWHGTALAAV